MANARVSRKFRKKFELEMKPVLEAKDQRIAELERIAANERNRAASAERGERELGDRLREFFDRHGGVRMKLEDPTPNLSGRGQRYRLMLDLDESLIREALAWGNDRHLIEHLGRSLGHQAMIEISRINFGRPIEGRFG